MADKLRKKQSVFDYIGSDRNSTISDLLKAIQAKFEAIDNRHRVSLYKCMSATFALRIRLNDEDGWTQFCADPRWEKRQPRNRPKPEGATEAEKTHFVAIAAFAGKGEVRIDRASKYGSVIEHYRKLGLMADRLPEELKNDGGIDKILSEMRGKKLADVQAAELAALRASENDDDGDEPEDNPDAASSDQDNNNSDDEGSNNDDDGAERLSPKDSAKMPRRLGLDSTDQVFDAAIAIPVGKKFMIEAVREEAVEANKWKTIRALRIITN